MAAPRSLADDLRTRSDEDLAVLVARRPDLIHPVPADLGALALRAGSAASVAARLRDADQLTLHVILAAALGPAPTTPAALVGAVAPAIAPSVGASAARERVRAVVASLRADALLWGADRALHLVGAARDLIVPAEHGPRLAALDPVVAGYVADPAALRALLDDAPAAARAAVDRLLAGPLVGTVADARRTPDPSRSPIDWLLTHHVVVPLGVDRVIVPAEVATTLRGGDPPPALSLVAPLPEAAGMPPDRLEAAAVGARIDLLHRVAEVGLRWADSPPSRVRTGGIAQRDLTATARALGCSEWQLALAIETAAAAGLLAGDAHDALTVLPTAGFDVWLRHPPSYRLATLLWAWLALPRTIGVADARPMSPQAHAPIMPGVRAEVLATMAGSEGPWDHETLGAALTWAAPRKPASPRLGLARDVLAELDALGVSVAGQLTVAGRALLEPIAKPLIEALAATLPPVVDALVLQADLTATVAGLPTPELAALLRLAADTESAGAASVYRFSPTSVRRWLDAGRSGGELLAELGRRGAVPQPLQYLVDDVARRHATLRIGAAVTYLRCDDPVALAAILADPGAAALGLVAVAETVLVSAQPPEHVLDRLRALGHAPLAEPGSGVDGPIVRRARNRPAAEPPTTPSEVTPALAAAAVRAMRASDRPGSERDVEDGTGPQAIPVGTPAEVIEALRTAISTESAVWLGYADPSGVAADRRVEPLRLTGGYLTAMDLRSASIQSFALARITGVEPDGAPAR